MLIKVLCPCGTKFAFEVEPVHGRMPVRVQCPACNADATSLANAAIAEQPAAAASPPAAPAPSVSSLGDDMPVGSVRVSPLAAPVQTASTSEPPRVRLRSAPSTPSVAESEVAAAAPPPEAPKLRVRLAGAQPTTESAPAPEVRGEFCPRHPSEPIEDHCRVCGKAICLKCMELHGYVCSVFCRNKAEAMKLDVPRYARQRSVVDQAARSKGRLVGMAVGGVLALLFAVWFWWEFFGTKPRVVYSLKIPKTERGTTYELLSPTEVLVLKDRQLALLDIAKGREVWSTALEAPKDAVKPEPAPVKKSTPAKKAAPQKPAGPTDETAAGKLVGDAAKQATGQPAAQEEEEEEEWDFGSFGTPTLLRTTGDLWLKFPDRLAAYDRQTGTRKQEVPLKSPFVHLTVSDAAIIAVATDEREVRTVTLIALPAGTVKSEQIAPPPNPAARLARGARGAAAFAAPSDDENSQRLEPVELRDDFLAAGPNVVEYKTRLLEKKVEVRQAMKPKPAQGLMESGRVTAGQSLEAVQELMNEMTRSATGGTIQEDVSRYQVSLRRLLGTEAPQWFGEVIGPPSFFPLKTVDVVFGSKNVIVLDKANKKRWEAKLTYNLDRGYALGPKDEAHFPCAETADALYVFDQGTLTCFELNSGQARWRLTSVGISRVQFDAQGKLYVNTTTASPDVIDFPQQINIHDRPQPILMKVDPATGKVLWKVTSRADECILRGKFVYAARTSSGVYASGTYFNLYRLNPSNGREMWHYYQERWPRNTGYQGNHFLLQWKDELQVLKFLTL